MFFNIDRRPELFLVLVYVKLDERDAPYLGDVSNRHTTDDSADRLARVLTARKIAVNVIGSYGSKISKFMFTRAIVRPPSDNFADGLTSVDLGAPVFEKALAQHRAYCEALIRCGLTLIELEADPAYPDSTFVEDTAIVTENCAVITNPGAESRKGEVVSIVETLSKFYDRLDRVQPPGTVDGGDVCQIGSHFLIGISERTNREGAEQLSGFLNAESYTSSHVDVRGTKGLLHLKSGITFIGENRLIVADSLLGQPEFGGYEIVRVPAGEEYAANCIRVNDYVLFAAGFPKLKTELEKLGYNLIELEMSEFEKMDGGLSCLSLRF